MALISQQDRYLNFEVSLSNSIHSLKVVKYQKSNHFFKMFQNLPSKLPPYFTTSLLIKINERIFHDQTQEFLSENKKNINLNLVLEKTLQLTFVSNI